MLYRNYYYLFTMITVYVQCTIQGSWFVQDTRAPQYLIDIADIATATILESTPFHAT